MFHKLYLHPCVGKFNVLHRSNDTVRLRTVQKILLFLCARMLIYIYIFFKTISKKFSAMLNVEPRMDTAVPENFLYFLDYRLELHSPVE